MRAYQETRRAVEQRRDEIATQGLGRDYTRLHGGSHRASDPTGFAATLLASDCLLREMARTVDAIHTVYEQLPPEHRRLVELAYWRRQSVQQVADELCVSRETFYLRRRAILVAIAARLGWR
ncbi:MAG: transcriptional regulator [Chloroflexi bacterium]|nr:transcriptional regulator [Chloroflexota bacterium]